MYQAFFLFALLAFTAGAPYGDVNSQRSFSTMQEKSVVQQPSFRNANLQQDDDSQLVDSLGGGYSFFKKQPIVARPLIQQQLAINEQQAPITSFSDTADQWSDYTRASAFKHQPKTHIMSVNKNLIKDQGAYGSQLSQEQPLIRDAPSSYGQQEVRTFVQPQQQQQQLIRDDSSSYGQQDLQQSWTPKSNSGYGQQDIQTLVQQQPLIRDAPQSSYGQQDLQKSWTPKSNSGYGQQEVRTLVQQQQPLIRDAPQSSYGQQDLQQPWAPKSNSGYGQQNVRTLVQQQPLIRDDSSSYGQQEVRTFVQPQQQQQQLIRDDSSSYGQQDLQQSWTPKSNSGYGQQEVRTLVQPQQQQQLIRDDSSSYGQQDLQQQWAPKSTTGYGQNIQQKVLVPTAQPSWSFQHQTELPQQSSSMISSRTFSQQQPAMQKSTSGSYGSL